MIDFALSDEERLARKTAREFAARRLAPDVRRHEREGVPGQLTAEAEALGLFETRGLVRALVLEELAAADVAATVALDRIGPARFLLEALGADAQVGSVSLVVDDGSWVIRAAADVHVVVEAGRTFVVAGARVEPVASIAFDALGCGTVSLEGSSKRPLRDDPVALARALDETRAHQAALLVGLARAAWEYATRYAQDRVTFGRRLVDHQALAFMLVEMAMAVDVARLALWRAASGSDARQARAALEEASDAALTCTDRAVQLLGGHGYLEDHPVEKWMREARALPLAWGRGGRRRKE